MLIHDNRDMAEMENWYTARIEALQNHITKLEEIIRQEKLDQWITDGIKSRSGRFR